MKLETKRLELVALNEKQHKIWVEDLSSLEKELNCTYKGEQLEGPFLELIQYQTQILQKETNIYPWRYFWLIIRKCDRVVVGSIDFKNEPNSDGEVEIGYGLGYEFEHNGYMTETVKAISNWALQQDSVNAVIAETKKDNVASQRVLERCGFVLYKEDNSLWWKLTS